MHVYTHTLTAGRVWNATNDVSQAIAYLSLLVIFVSSHDVIDCQLFFRAEPVLLPMLQCSNHNCSQVLQSCTQEQKSVVKRYEQLSKNALAWHMYTFHWSVSTRLLLLQVRKMLTSNQYLLLRSFKCKFASPTTQATLQVPWRKIKNPNYSSLGLTDNMVPHRHLFLM